MGQPSDFTLRDAEQDEEEKLVPFLDASFRGWPSVDTAGSAEDYWRWKHMDNPLGASHVVVAETGGTIIGVNHSNFLKVKIGSEYHRGVTLCDLAVHRDHRGGGIHASLMRHTYRRLADMGVKFTVSITGNPMLIKSMTSRNIPRFHHPIAIYVNIRDVENLEMEGAWLKKTGYQALSLVNEIANQLKTRPKTDPGVNVTRSSGFSEGFEGFWEKLSSCYDYISLKSTRYMNWRYLDPRVGGNRVFLATRGDEVVGFAVTRVNRREPKTPVGYVMELAALPGYGDAASALLSHAVEDLYGQGVNLVLALAVKGNPVENVYSRNGFLDSRERLMYFLNPVGDFDGGEAMKGWHASRIHFSWGDHDSLPLSPRRL